MLGCFISIFILLLWKSKFMFSYMPIVFLFIYLLFIVDFDWVERSVSYNEHQPRRPVSLDISFSSMRSIAILWSSPNGFYCLRNVLPLRSLLRFFLPILMFLLQSSNRKKNSQKLQFPWTEEVAYKVVLLMRVVNFLY